MNIRSLNGCIADTDYPMLVDIVVCPFRVLLETVAPRDPADPVDLL